MTIANGNSGADVRDFLNITPLQLGAGIGQFAAALGQLARPR